MQLYKRIGAILLLGVALLLSGCGNTGTSGSIVLTLAATDSQIGSFDVLASAVFSKLQTGVPIKLTWRNSTSSNPIGTTGSVELKTDATGTITNLFNVQQGSEIIRFEVIASAGDLKSEAKTVTIPARGFSNISTATH